MRKSRRTRRTRRGGMWPFSSAQESSVSPSYSSPSYSSPSYSSPSSSGNMWDSITSSASGLWNKAKQSVSSLSSQSQQPSYSSTPSYGGRHRGRRHKRGGTRGWTPLTGIAAHGAPFHGATAKPQVWVGGKSRRRRTMNRKKGTRRH
jgi:hypothetical protein